MPIVPTTGPTVENKAQPFVPQSSAADTPQAFGAQIGAADQELGKGIGFDAKVAGDIAQDNAINQSIRDAKAADTANVTRQTALEYQSLPGGPDGNKGFFSLHGQAAVDALPIYQKALKDGEDQTVQSFGDNTRTANMYQSQSQIRIAQAQQRAAAYANSQGQVADVNASTSRIQSYNDSFTANYNSPAALKNYQQVVTGEMQTQGRLQGWQPDQLAEATKQQLSKGYSDAILAAAAAGDITTAGRMFQQLSGGMTAQTQVALAEHLKPKLQSAAAAAWVNGNLSTGGSGPAGAPSGDVAEAIHGQESGGRATSITSVDGAMGGWQITPATFKQYAKDGESITNPADNERVGRRIVQDLSDRFGGDPARIAVGYFSGPDNVAPAGSATPYIEDKKDGNGTSTSSYVNGVLGRMKGGGAPSLQNAAYNPDNGVPPSVQQAASSSSAQRVASDSIVHPDFDGLVEKAGAQFANDPEMFNKVLGNIRQQQAQYNMGVHTQREALTKTFSDTAAALADGQDVAIPEVAIRHAFDKPQADEMVLKLQQAQDFGQIYKGIQTMPAADLAQARQKLADGLGAKAAFPTLNGKAINAGAPGDSDETPDFTNKYNTNLSPDDEAKFQAWGKEQAAKNNGRNPAQDTFDYDMRGFWKAADGNPTFADNGHAGDAFKKPNHPTFSTFSNYNGVDGYQGGAWSGGQDGKPWNFAASPTNVQMQGAQGLKDYYTKVEAPAGNTLTMPDAQATNYNPEGYAQRQQELAHFDAAVAKRNKLLTDDPAGYAQSLPPVAAAFASAGQDPVKLQAAIQLSQSTQRGLGVADSDVRTLPTSTIGSIVKTLHTASPDGKGRGRPRRPARQAVAAIRPAMAWRVQGLGDGRPPRSVLPGACRHGPADAGRRAGEPTARVAGQGSAEGRFRQKRSLRSEAIARARHRRQPLQLPPDHPVRRRPDVR